MAETIKKVLVLKFGYAMDATKNAQISISKAKEGLTSDQIKSAMQRVLAANSLIKKGETAPIDKIVEANYVNTVTEELAL